MDNVFLQAEWRKLVIANYFVDKQLLKKHLPNKTEIDLWNGNCYVSLVGFMFKDTRIKGLQIPFHRDFEEVNLRFYVRYKEKRGVVFIKEIVPKPALTFVANSIYKENYQTMPMRHSWTESQNEMIIEYKWKKKQWNTLQVTAENNSRLIKEGSEEEFITEHYWGYTKVNNEKTYEYEVKHPRWEIYDTKKYFIDVDFADVYGQDFSFLKNEQPVSVFLAEGSEIKVNASRKI